jgi:excisionase family DNA binding protein
MGEEEEFLTVTDAAKVKGVSRQAIWAAISDKRLTAKLYGRFYLIRRADLEAWEVVGHRPRKEQA